MKFGAPAMVALFGATLLLYSAFFGARLARYDGEVTAFIGFGCFNKDVCWSRDNREILPGRALVFDTGGYDGQFYYYIAASLARFEAPVVDAPPLRLARIGYPLLSLPAAWVGPGALVLWMLLLPFVLHLLMLSWLCIRAAREVESSVAGADAARGFESLVPWVGPLLFALNPLALFANGLALADGLALSLGVLSLLCYERGRESAPVKAWLAAAFAATTLACLTKETMLALPLGFAVAALLRRDPRGVLFWLATLAPVASYWFAIRFSPGMAADRGGWPFAGFLEFLGSGQVGGGRAFLVVLFPLYIMAGLWSASMAWGARRAIDPLGLAGVLGASVVLISFATADEYWANFANISRFFIPGVLALVFAPWFTDAGRQTKGWLRPVGRMLAVALVLVMLAFALALVAAEFRAGPLPYEVWR